MVAAPATTDTTVTNDARNRRFISTSGACTPKGSPTLRLTHQATPAILRRAISTDIPEFRARILVIQESGTDAGYVLPIYSGNRAIRFSRAVASRRTGWLVPMVGRRSAVGGHAAAFVIGP